VSHRLLQAGNPERLIAFACPDVGVGGPPWREPERSEPEHEAHRWCRLVASELAVPADPGDLRLGTAISSSTTCDVRRGPVVVHPGAASIGRRWPAERFASVARSLAWGFAASEPGAGRVVLTGSAEEAALCRRVADQAGLDPRADLAGSLDLARLCRLLATARLLVCGDTGVAHLATALGTPSVLLFGPTPPGLWGPLIDLDRHRVLWRPDPGDDRGDPHTDDLDPALARITMEEVLAEASSLLFRMRPGHDRTR
jgi:ADP-heptose:LPS heptosyltransferase